MSDMNDETLKVLRHVPLTVVNRPRVSNLLAYARKQTINAVVNGVLGHARARAQGNRRTPYFGA